MARGKAGRLSMQDMTGVILRYRNLPTQAISLLLARPRTHCLGEHTQGHGRVSVSRIIKAGAGIVRAPVREQMHQAPSFKVFSNLLLRLQKNVNR